MPTGLFIDTKQLTKGAKAFDDAIKQFPRQISSVLTANAEDIVRNAKRAAPADMGQIRQGISADNSNLLKKVITSHAPYSAYMEFGTGRYAAKYVATLPPTYQAFASQFRGKTGGGFHEFVNAILDWVIRKGLAATYSVKTRKRQGSLSVSSTHNTGQKGYKIKDEFERAMDLAYAIATNILRNGVHPHPFLIPAFIKQQKQLKREMLEAVVTLMKLR